MTAALSHRETDDTYRGVIALLNTRWRIVACRDGIQWILQHRASAKETYAGARWSNRSFCRTRAALIRDASQHAGEIWPAAMTILRALPERIELSSETKTAQAAATALDRGSNHPAKE